MREGSSGSCKGKLQGKQQWATLGAVRKTVLSSSKSSLSNDDWDMLCCGISPAGMSIDAVDANAEPACTQE